MLKLDSGSSKFGRKKVNVTYTIEKQLRDRFKQASDKDARKMSQVVESYIRRYVESKTS